MKRVPGLKSYRTAWTRLHKLRRAMVRPGSDLLTGPWCIPMAGAATKETTANGYIHEATVIKGVSVRVGEGRCKRWRRAIYSRA
jgi:hypothetical protein